MGYHLPLAQHNLRLLGSGSCDEIKKKGHIFSETLNNWKYIVGDDLFQICYPKSFKNSNKFGVSTLQIMVKRGHEIDLEYSKKVIMDKMNSFFGYAVVEKLKFISFDDAQTKFKKLDTNENHVTNIINVICARESVSICMHVFGHLPIGNYLTIFI